MRNNQRREIQLHLQLSNETHQLINSHALLVHQVTIRVCSYAGVFGEVSFAEIIFHFNELLQSLGFVHFNALMYVHLIKNKKRTTLFLVDRNTVTGVLELSSWI